LIDAVSKLDRGLDLLPASLDVVLGDYPPIDEPLDCSNAEGVLLMACNQTAVNAGIHDNITVEALKRIIRHLSGVPGRKNLVWVKESLQIPQANVALYPVLIRTVVVGNPFKFGPDFMDTQHRVRELAATTGGAGFSDAADLKNSGSHRGRGFRNRLYPELQSRRRNPRRNLYRITVHFQKRFGAGLSKCAIGPAISQPSPFSRPPCPHSKN
jgi:hypothetical protein